MGMFGDDIKRWLFIILLFMGSFSAQASLNTTAPRPLRLLFLGNSLTFMPDKTNTKPVTPFLVKSLLETKNISVEIDWVTAGGHTLQDHWDEGIFREHLEKHREGYYDYVFIQPYTIEALELPSCFLTKGPAGIPGPEGREMFLEYGKKMIRLVRDHGSRPIVIEPWTYDPHHDWMQPNFDCLDFPGTTRAWFGRSLDDYQTMLDDGYTELRYENHVELLRVGRFWKMMRDNPSQVLPISQMYLEDHFHPTTLGALLTAYLEVQRLTKLPADQFSYLPEGVSPAQANYLQKLAMQYFTTTAFAQ
jgi:hypothetical protein